MSDATLHQWITEQLGDETVEAVVLGPPDPGLCLTSAEEAHLPAHYGRVLSWAEAEPHLHTRFDDGLGAAEAEALYVWTATRVFFVCQYDGSTWLTRVPRHPTPGIPGIPGGD
jgi:hypothetical protein